MPAQRISTWLAIRCREPLFWRFLKVDDEPSAIHLVRALCDVTSRREFDYDKEAAQRFHEIIRRPFLEFTNNQEQKSVRPQ